MAEFAVLIQKYFSTYIDECNIYICIYMQCKTWKTIFLKYARNAQICKIYLTLQNSFCHHLGAMLKDPKKIGLNLEHNCCAAGDKFQFQSIVILCEHCKHCLKYILLNLIFFCSLQAITLSRPFIESVCFQYLLMSLVAFYDTFSLHQEF